MADANDTNPGTALTDVPAAQKPQGKVFTEDYVTGLREEAKTNRLAKKLAEERLKKLLGLGVDDDVDDAKIAAYTTNQATVVSQAVQKANEKLILAEIKAATDYNTKLVDKLLDKSKLKVADDGTVTGLTEALAALALEFPEIKKTKQTDNTPSGNPAGASNGGTPLEQLKTQYAKALKDGKTAEAVRLKDKIWTEEHK